MALLLEEELLLDSSLDELRMTFGEELLQDSSPEELGMAFVGKLLESEEHAKNPTLAAVTIIRDVANFLNIL